jgi:hypothetical protein
VTVRYPLRRFSTIAINSADVNILVNSSGQILKSNTTASPQTNQTRGKKKVPENIFSLEKYQAPRNFGRTRDARSLAGAHKAPD